MNEEYTSSATKLLEQFHCVLGRPDQEQVRRDSGIPEANYWIARALLEVAEQLDGIRFELSGSKG